MDGWVPGLPKKDWLVDVWADVGHQQLLSSRTSPSLLQPVQPLPFPFFSSCMSSSCPLFSWMSYLSSTSQVVAEGTQVWRAITTVS
ncbi:hypothetical protein E2C01_044551 [Portunus trituberculatus]|uniref:Uncharacterized protein n=1 Tax=Portunus trituberculatus TaxID=210409 RepID=A0A5B7FTE9_PORTR|nr:hypothetical protein [Portunus trituberculatus]